MNFKNLPIGPRHILAGLLLWGVAAGCGGSALMVTRADVTTPGAVRVQLKEQDDDFFAFIVYNQSPYPMVVDRNAVRMATAAGLRSRLPGGLMDVYTIPPGAAHDVHVKFKMDGLHPGETIWVHFQDAISINGQRVPVEPVQFVAR